MNRTDIELTKTDGFFWDWSIPSLKKVSTDSTRALNLAAAIFNALGLHEVHRYSEKPGLEGFEEEIRVRVEWPNEKVEGSRFERTIGAEVFFTRTELTQSRHPRELVAARVQIIENEKAAVDA